MSSRRSTRVSLGLPVTVTLLVSLLGPAAAAQGLDPLGAQAASFERVRQALGGPDRPKLDAAPQAAEPPEHIERPFWNRRKVGIAAGLGAAGAALTVALFKEGDLRERKAAIQALPPGANDEWARQRAEAENILKERNFWLAAAVGIGGVTVASAIALRRYDIPLIRPPQGSPAGLRRSTVRLRPFTRGAAVIWDF